MKRSKSDELEINRRREVILLTVVPQAQPRGMHHCWIKSGPSPVRD